MSQAHPRPLLLEPESCLAFDPCGEHQGLGAWLPRTPGGVEMCVCHTQRCALSPQTRAHAAASVVSPVWTPLPGSATQLLGVSPSDLACSLTCRQDGEEGSWAQVRPPFRMLGVASGQALSSAGTSALIPLNCGLRLVVRMGVPAPPRLASLWFDPFPRRARLRWGEPLSGTGDLSKGLPSVYSASTSSLSSCQAPGFSSCLDTE